MNSEHVQDPPGGLDLVFLGPFAWLATADVPSIFDAIEPDIAGIYLWAVDRGDGHLVSYVGETGRCVRKRMAEHYAEHAAGRYLIHEPSDYARGIKAALWPGHYGKDACDLGNCVRASIELAPKIVELSRMLRFFVARTTCDQRMRRRAEAAIADELYRAPGTIGAFQDSGVLYQRRRQSEPPVTVSIKVVHNQVVLGLPAIIQA